ALWHTDQAAFLLAGPGLPAGGRIAEPREVADVAPTVLALLGLPPGEGWRGTLLPGATDPGLAPLDYVTLLPTASYRDRAAGPAPVAPEFLAQLRAIGYLGEADDGSAGSAGTAGGETARPAPADGELLDLETATRGQLNNL